MKSTTRVCVSQIFSLLVLIGLIGCSSDHLLTGPEEAGNLPEVSLTEEQPTSAIRIGFTPPALGKPHR